MMEEIMRQREPGPESRRRGHPRGRRQARLREARLERGRGQAGQPRGRRRRALAGAPARGARKVPELMAPSHAIREKINAIVRERLVREGVVRGPAFLTERLVSRGYTNPQKSLAANYSPGDVVAFHRPYKRIGVEKGDELRVKGVDHEGRRRHPARQGWTGRSAGSQAVSRRAQAVSRSTASSIWRCARATGSAGPGTTRTSAS